MFFVLRATDKGDAPYWVCVSTSINQPQQIHYCETLLWVIGIKNTSLTRKARNFIVKELLKYEDVDVNQELELRGSADITCQGTGLTPLFFAVATENEGVVRELLQRDDIANSNKI